MQKKITLLTMLVAFVVFNFNALAQNNPAFSQGATRAVLLEESFESSYPPSGWTRVNATLNSNRRTSTRNPSGHDPFHGSYLVYFNSFNAAANTVASLATPVFDASDPNTAFSFAMFRDEGKPTNADKLDIEISTDGGTTWSNFAGPYMRNTTSGYYWEEVVLYITEGTENTKMRFVCTSGKGNDVHIDYVRAYTYFDHDLSIEGVTPTVLLSGNSASPVVTIKNIGVNAENDWSINLTNGEGYNSTMTGSALAPNQAISVTMDEWTPADGTYTFTATLTMTGDEDMDNNVYTFPVLVAPMCEPIRIDMFDSFGDGWNGITAIHLVQCGTVVGTAKLEEDISESVIITPYQGDVDFVWVSDRVSYDEECYFSIHYAGGQIYASSGTPEAGTFLTWTCGTTCEPVTDLTAVTSGNNVELSWIAPSGTPTGYEVYLNNTLLETVTTTSYTHASAPSGIHTYKVKALFGDDCLPSTESVEVTVGDLCELTVVMSFIDEYEEGYSLGWQNGRIDVIQHGNVIATARLYMGDFMDTLTVMVGGGEVEFVWVEGQWDDACAFSIHYAGNVLHSANGNATAGTFLTWNCTTACDPITNLTASVNEFENDVLLSWTAPAGTPTGYEILFNGTILTTVTTTTYTHTSAPDGNHLYTVRALFEGGCIPSGESVNIVVGPTCSLTINMFDGNGDGWDNGAHVKVYQNGVVLTTFSLDDGESGTTTILTYGGEVQFVYAAAGNWDHENSFVIISEGEEIYSSGPLPETGTTLFTWTCGYRCEPTTDFAATVSGHDVNLSWTAPEGNPTGYVISVDGTALETVTTTNYTHASVPNGYYLYSVGALFGETCIPVEQRAYVTVGNLCAFTVNIYDEAEDGWNDARIDIVQEGVVVESVRMLDGSSATTTVVVPGGELEFVWVEGEYDDECSFIIFYEGEDIYATTGTPEAGTFMTRECGTPCAEIRNLDVTVQASTAILNWDAPAEGTPTSYLIYLDGNQTEEILATENQYPLEWLPNGNYSAAVAAVFANENNCYPIKVSVDFTILSCANPTDFTAVYNTECHAVLTWVAPAKTPNTYNIYRDGTLIASDITETTYTDNGFDPLAPHTWEIEYLCPDGGESAKESVSLVACRDDENVDDRYFDQIVISPNPAIDVVNITGATLTKIEVYNTMGQLINSQIENVTTVNVSSYSNGIYFFKLYNADNESTIRKIVISK